MKLKEHSGILGLLLIIVVTTLIIAVVQILHPPKEPNISLEALRVKYAQESGTYIDHSQFPILQQEFKSAQEVSATCLTCHEDRHEEVINSSHFNWERISYVEDRGIRALGKKNGLNNYCISVIGSEAACTKCHTGYGMIDPSQFDFTSGDNADCLSCHAQSPDYSKEAGAGGIPVEGLDLAAIAQTVGRPSMENCGSCHFYGGGGNNVKHGDLEEALYNATRDIDVHMAIDGINMTCVDCHTAEDHQILGKLYSVSSNNVNRMMCESCHTQTPHLSEMLNKHTVKVSCQTCHIPEYAKVNPTKMEWYWSDAGDLENGEPYTLDNESGEHEYLSIKGSFKWASNVQPEYVWFNGKADHYFMGDVIDTSAGAVQVNTLLGDHTDPDSKIIPVKVHRGDQIFDTENLLLVQPKLYSQVEGDSAYWSEFDWALASEAGMNRLNLPFSGEYDFIQTEMYWPVNHMVSKASVSLQCADCHTQNNGRLENLTGFYLPGRDRNETLDFMGRWMIILSVFGTILHGVSRIVTHIFVTEDFEMAGYEEFEDGEN